MGLPDFFSKKVGAGPENHLQLEGVWSSRLRFRLPETNGKDIGVMTQEERDEMWAIAEDLREILDLDYPSDLVDEDILLFIHKCLLKLARREK